MSALPRYSFKAADLLSSKRISRGKLDEIKEWTTNNASLPEMPEEQLTLFLLVCEDVVELTKNTILKYFKYQVLQPEFFLNRDVDSEELQATHNVSNFTVIPRRTKDNYAVGTSELKDTSWYNFILEPQIKALFMSIDLMYNKDPPSGFIYIISLKDVGIMHLTKIKPTIAKRFFNYLQEALPAQLKKVHILNANYIFDKVMYICKPFIKKELYNMIMVHPSGTPMEEFFAKHVEAECMPSDYGGLQPDAETLSAQLQEDLRKLKPFYEQCERQVEAYKMLCSV